jgi:rhodanese-related sulfurtransferase
LGIEGAAAESPKDAQNRRKLAAMMDVNRKAFPGVSEISTEKLIEGLSVKSIVLIDVRPENERTVSIIPGSITPDEFDENRSKYQGMQPVSYCTVGYRSAAFAKKMKGRGIDVQNFNGSILSWCQGQKLQTLDGKPTNRVHVYGRKWNLLPEGYEGVW